METSDTFFFFDGTNVVGPHSGREISQMFHAGSLKEDAQVCTANDHAWKSLKDFPSLLEKPAELTRTFTEKPDEPADNIKKDTGKTVITDDDDDEDEEEERFTPIKSVRALLNDLWEAQRESIISKVKNEELDERYEHKRKAHTEIKNKVEDCVLEYWRRGKVLDAWIRDLIWEGEDERGDYRKRLKKGDLDGNFEMALSWPEDSGLSDLAGCYAFRDGKNYIYIGKADDLGRRLKQHEGQAFWGTATHLRILIPQHKASVLKLERLLILKHQPDRNKNDGVSTEGSKADEVLELINSEINQLLTDG
jgi:predicted GIY-YIG superfamily endonuclease